jgi:hypothetical protein
MIMRTLQNVSPFELELPSNTAYFARVAVGPPLVDRVHPVDPALELLEVPALLVPDLPEPMTLWLAVDGAPARVLLTTDRTRAAQVSSSLADVIIFDREELHALFLAVQADRVWRKDLLGMCFDKWRKPDHRLTVEDALAGANPDARDWSLGRVLARLGATLERIEWSDREVTERDVAQARELSQRLSVAA